MAYHLGRMLQLGFGCEAIAVTINGERGEYSVREYDVVFPTMAVDAMLRIVWSRLFATRHWLNVLRKPAKPPRSAISAIGESR